MNKWMMTAIVLTAVLSGTLVYIFVKGAPNSGLAPTTPPSTQCSSQRFREVLQPGKTYKSTIEATLSVNADHTDWGIKKVGTLTYQCEAEIDREVKENDGETVVEVRHFKNVESVKLLTELKDVQLSLGNRARGLLTGLSWVAPTAAPVLQGINTLDGKSTKVAIDLLKRNNLIPNDLLPGEETRIFRQVDDLTGKRFRLTYVNGKGVTKIEPIGCEMTEIERKFLEASVLAADGLIFPDRTVAVGDSWKVRGECFGGLIDPSLRASTSGTMTLTRRDDKGKMAVLSVTDGRLKLRDSNEQRGSLGWFDPKGDLLFSLQHHVVQEADLKGAASLDISSNNHILFRSHIQGNATIQVIYKCDVQD